MKKSSSTKINVENEEEYIKWCASLNNISIGSEFASLINEHNSEIEKRKLSKKDKYKERLSYNMHYKLGLESNKKAILSINVSDKERNRAYKFTNVLIAAFKDIGGTVMVDIRNCDNTIIRFPYCTFECSLEEKRCKYRNVKADGLNTMRPSYDLIDTGKFIFKIYPVDDKGDHVKEIIFDEEKNTLLEQLGTIFINIRPILLEISKKNIEIERVHNEEAEEKTKQWNIEWEKEKEIEKLQKQRELTQRKQESIINHMKDWEQIKNINEYIIDVKTYAEMQPENVKVALKYYCDYVTTLFNINEFYLDITEFSKLLDNNEQVYVLI